MANYYTVTSYTLAGPVGSQLKLGPVGIALLEAALDDGYFQKNELGGWYIAVEETTMTCENFTEEACKLLGVSEASLASCLEQAMRINPGSTTITQAMVDKAKSLGYSDDAKDDQKYDPLDIIELIEIVELEEGASEVQVMREAGWWCDKNRHGEFGGAGYFLSKNFSFGYSSDTPILVGRTLEESVQIGDWDEVGRTITNGLLSGVLGREETQTRVEIITALIEELQGRLFQTTQLIEIGGAK